MSEQLNGKRKWAFIFFQNLVAQALLKRKYFDNMEDGRKFAEDLDMSFDALYSEIPRTEWPRLIGRDCVDYLKSIGRHDLVKDDE